MSFTMKFICCETDDDEEIIPNSGCGEVDHLHLHLYDYIDTAGEGLYVTLKNDGTVFFKEEQSWHHPSYWDQSKLIEIVKSTTDRKYSLDFGQCPHYGGCALVEYSEED